MVYINFFNPHVCVKRDEIYKIVFDCEKHVNFYFRNEVIIVNDLAPEPSSFFLEGENIEDEVLGDWFQVFCECLSRDPELDNVYCVSNLADEATRELFRIMEGWREGNPDLFKTATKLYPPKNENTSN